MYICGKIAWQMKEIKPTYKKQGNITLFDNEETMFKIVVLQRIYHLSDAQAEYHIRDRLSFRDFL